MQENDDFGVKDFGNFGTKNRCVKDTRKYSKVCFLNPDSVSVNVHTWCSRANPLCFKCIVSTLSHSVWLSIHTQTKSLMCCKKHKQMTFISNFIVTSEKCGKQGMRDWSHEGRKTVVALLVRRAQKDTFVRRCRFISSVWLEVHRVVGLVG